MSKVVRQRLSGVSITSAGTGLVRFILLHRPDMMWPKMARRELGILQPEVQVVALRILSLRSSLFYCQLTANSTICHIIHSSAALLLLVACVLNPQEVPENCLCYTL